MFLFFFFGCFCFFLFSSIFPSFAARGARPRGAAPGAGPLVPRSHRPVTPLSAAEASGLGPRASGLGPQSSLSAGMEAIAALKDVYLGVQPGSAALARAATMRLPVSFLSCVNAGTFLPS